MKLANGVNLPAAAVTQTFGILAVRGAGKSNTAVVLFEELVRAGHQAVTVDPVGAHWGVRSSADGKGPGLEVPIFGGRHGDVDLKPDAGVMVADLLVDERLPAVLDVSDFGKAERLRFLSAFGERLYRRNRDPLHLILEEADDYVPQKPMKGPALQCLSVFQDIVRRGRARGLGITMVTQRSAVIHKDVLTQIETLIVLRTTSPQDRKAIAAWVDQHGQARELLESLPSLKPGEAWVWSPHFLDIMKRIQVRRRSTYDSGATPTGRGRRVAKMADVDLGAIEAKMVTAERGAQLRDPARLRARIRELEQLLETEQARALVPSAPTVQVQGVPVVKPAEARRLAITATRLEKTARKLDLQAEALRMTAEAITGSLEKAFPPAPPRVERVAGDEPGVASRRVQRRANGDRRGGSDEGDLTGPERRILDAIAWLEPLVPAPEQTAVAFLAGYTVGGGGFNNPRGRLRQRGLIEYQGDRLLLTPEGRSLAAKPPAPVTAPELHAAVKERLPGPERRILDVLLEAHPKGLTNEETAERAGYRAGGGGYNNPRGRLRTLGLIEYVGGEVRARDMLFP